MNLSENEISRYERHIKNSEIGIEGQQKIKNARVLVIGSGGLGSPVLYYLVASGVGNVGIVESDSVEISNLQRQTLFIEEDVGRSKAKIAAQRLSKLNSSTKIDIYEERFSENNAQKLLSNYDILIDCPDNFETRLLANKICFLENKPHIYAAVEGFFGQITTFNPKKNSPCLRCIIPENPVSPKAPSVISSTPGVFGSLQATECIKVICDLAGTLEGRFLCLDTLSMRFSNLNYEKDKNCKFCKNL